KGNENAGVSTDVHGEFVLKGVSKGDVLIVSNVGFLTQEIVLEDQTTLNIILESTSETLEEVVVVGYGVQKKQSIVGAISQVDSEYLIKSGYNNITSSMAGKLPGVTVLQQSGEPGANAADITIRGISSWNDSRPLVLVDGVERDFVNMEPNEIETISVLKDASATAVFGAKGANGVVIVTTKRGTLGQPRFDFWGSYGLNTATGVPDHIDSYTTMKMLNVARMNDMQYSQLLPDHILEEYRNPSTPLN